MDCAANLFVKKDVADKAIDTVIGANGPFTQIACAWIGIQHREQIGFVLHRGRADNFSLLESELDAFYLPPALNSRIGEAHPAVNGFFYWSGEDFTAGHVIGRG